MSRLKIPRSSKIDVATMMIISIVSLLLAPVILAAVDAPSSITLIRPNPDIQVPQNANLTYGFVSSDTQYWGLIQNIVMSYRPPDGQTTRSASFGPTITDGGDFVSDGYTPAQCRSFPGTSVITVVNATQTGNYTFFWDVNYVESSDSTQANSSYCGPSPFSKQSWSLNSTVTVVEANAGDDVVAGTATTTMDLPSKPTGQVGNGAILTKGRTAQLGSLLGMIAGISLAV